MVTGTRFCFRENCIVKITCHKHFTKRARSYVQNVGLETVYSITSSGPSKSKDGSVLSGALPDSSWKLQSCIRGTGMWKRIFHILQQISWPEYSV